MEGTRKIAMIFTRCLFVENRQTGGIKRFIELSKYLSNTDDDFHIFSSDNSDVISENGIRNHERLKKTRSVFKALPPEAGMVLSNLSLFKRIKHSGYDDIIIFDVPTAIGPILCGLKKVVLMIRKDMIGYEKVQNRSKTKWIKIGYQWVCESICMLRAKLIITQCNYDKDVLKGRHPILAKCIEKKTIIQINNVNPSWIVSKSEKIATSEIKLGETNKFRVCFIGGFGNPRKGQDLFLCTAQQVLKIDQGYEFIMIGGGGGLEDYKNKYESDGIIFMGRQDNPIGILKQCELLVVPSYADSCPNTVMEALYNGVPVIGSRAGGIPEILNDETALFDLSSNSLLKSILKLKEDEEALIRLKEQQKIRKKELEFEWAQRIMEIIKKN